MTESTWVGDLIRALDALQPATDGEAVRAADMLGVPSIPGTGATAATRHDTSRPTPDERPVPLGATELHQDTPPPVEPALLTHRSSPSVEGLRPWRSLDIPTGIAVLVTVLGWLAGWLSLQTLAAASVGAAALNIFVRWVRRRRQAIPVRPSSAVEVARSSGTAVGGDDRSTTSTTVQAPVGTSDVLMSNSVGRDLDATALAGQAISDPSVPWSPLLDDRRLRSLASAALQVERPVGIDLTSAVRQMAAHGSLGTLPQRVAPRVASRAVVMVDESEALDAMRRDQDALLAAIEMVGGPGLRVVRFDGDPRWSYAPDDRFGLGPPVETAQALPSGATAVVVLSDLGIGRRRRATLRSQHHWRTFDTLVRSHPIRRLYLVPYPESRWPSPLEDLPTACWSDRLSVRDLRAPTS